MDDPSGRPPLPDELPPLFQVNSHPQGYTLQVGVDFRSTQPTVFDGMFGDEQSAQRSERGFERARDRAERRWDRNKGGDTSTPGKDKPFTVEKNPSGPGYSVALNGERVARYNDEGKANAVANALNEEHAEQSEKLDAEGDDVWDPEGRGPIVGKEH